MSCPDCKPLQDEIDRLNNRARQLDAWRAAKEKVATGKCIVLHRST